MEFPISAIGIVSVLCCFVLPIVVAIVWIFVAPTPDNILNRLFWKSLEQEADNEKKFRNALIQRGITAPANIVSLRSLAHYRKLSGGPYRVQVEFDVEVMPGGQPSFRSVFQHWLPISGRNEAGEAIRRLEAEPRIWVTFDPSDPSQIIFDHSDSEHEQVLVIREKVKKRNHFIDMEKESIQVRETGEETLAIVLEVEELGVEDEKEKREGKAVRIKFKVTPQTGADFESETFAMVAHESLPKFRTGTQVYVKLDPRKPEVSALMRLASQ